MESIKDVERNACLVNGTYYLAQTELAVKADADLVMFDHQNGLIVTAGNKGCLLIDSNRVYSVQSTTSFFAKNADKAPVSKRLIPGRQGHRKIDI